MRGTVASKLMKMPFGIWESVDQDLESSHNLKTINETNYFLMSYACVENLAVYTYLYILNQTMSENI